MTTSEFKFKINDLVARISTGEAGHIRDRDAGDDGSNHYLVRYLATDGTQVDDWWSEDDITR